MFSILDVLKWCTLWLQHNISTLFVSPLFVSFWSKQYGTHQSQHRQPQIEKWQEFALRQKIPFAQTSSLAGRSNKEILMGTVEKVQWRGFSKILFLQFQTERKKSFQWWSFEAALKPFPLRFWKRWQRDCIDEMSKLDLLQVFTYLGDPDVVSAASVCLHWAGQYALCN